MRSLPALLPTVAVLPVLSLIAFSPAAGAASRAAVDPTSRSAAVTVANPDPSLPAAVQRGSGAADVAVPAGRGDSGAAVVGLPAAHPVTPKIHEISLSAGVLSAQSITPKTSTVLTRRARTASFQTLGITWASRSLQPDLDVSVRTRSTKGVWSGWSGLDSDEGDDVTAVGPKVRGGTEPLWVGASDGVQARIVVKSGALPSGLRLELVDPGSSGFDRTAAESTPGGTAALSPSGAIVATTDLASAGLVSAQATGGVAEPLILSRAAWGADDSKIRNAPTYMPTIKAGVMHHTAGPNNYTAAQVPAIIRGDYAYHLSRGWSDIGYNALVDRFGRIWEGRAGGLSDNVMGAHAGGFNTDTFGVSVIGNYDTARPTAAAVAAVARVMAWKLDLNHRDPFGTTRLTSAGGGTDKYPAGETVTFPVIMGHRDTGRTDCPGKYLYPYLPAIRAQVKSLIQAALLNPAGPPASVPEGTAVSVTAHALAAQTWRLDVTAPCGGGRVARISGSAAAGGAITASWNGRLADGTVARAGRYTLTLTSSSSTAVARPVVEHVLLTPPAPVVVPTAPPSGGAGGYEPVTPARLLDTASAGAAELGPAGRVDVPVLGVDGVPAAGVTAVVLNLTADCVSAATSLAVWPTGGLPSGQAVTSVPAGATRSVLVTSRVGADGSVSIGNAHGVTGLTVDVVGYYRAGGLPVLPIGSTRLYASHTDPAGTPVAGQERLIPLPASLDGIPVGQISAVMVDVSALSPAGTGTLTAYRPGDPGTLPTLAYRKGQSVDNLAIVPVSGDAIAIRATGTPAAVDLDVRALVLAGPTTSTSGAVVSGEAFTAVKPALVVDSAKTGGALEPGKPRGYQVTGSTTGVPASAGAVLVDLTAVAPSTATSLQVYPWALAQGSGAVLRVSAGDTRGNLVAVPLGAGGAIGVANAHGSTQFRLVVVGYLQ